MRRCRSEQERYPECNLSSPVTYIPRRIYDYERWWVYIWAMATSWTLTVLRQARIAITLPSSPRSRVPATFTIGLDLVLLYGTCTNHRVGSRKLHFLSAGVTCRSRYRWYFSASGNQSNRRIERLASTVYLLAADSLHRIYARDKWSV